MSIFLRSTPENFESTAVLRTSVDFPTYPRIFSIEGNIGSGKTTLFNRLKKNMQNEKIRFISEPVEIWQSVKSCGDNEDILSKFYKNKEKYSFSFQIMVYLTFMKEIKKCIQENPSCKMIIVERSIQSGYNIFTKMAIDEKYMDDIQLQIYKMMFEDCPFHLSGIIYLDIEPEICIERVACRGRKGESVVSLEYLQKCKKYHDEWFLNTPNYMMTIKNKDFVISDNYKMGMIIEKIYNFVGEPIPRLLHSVLIPSSKKITTTKNVLKEVFNPLNW